MSIAPTSALAFGPKWEFGSYGTAAGQMRQPGNGAFGPNGDFYVADWKNNRIDVFSKPGAFLFAFGKEVNSGAGDPNVCTTAGGCRAGSEETPGDAATAGAMRHPLDLAFDQAGNVYVADEGNNRIDVFTADGEFLYALGRKVELGGSEGDVCTTASGCQAGIGSGEAGALHSPTGVEVSAGRLYVADNANNRIDVFDLAKEAFLFAFGEEVDPAGESACTELTGCQAGQASEAAGGMDHPYMLALDQSNQLEVTDPPNHRVDVFTVDGDFVEAYGREVNPAGGSFCNLECQAGEDSATAGGLKFPTAIVAALGARILVADAETNRIDEFNIGGFFRDAYGEGVDTGATAFETCSSVTTCQNGIEGTIPGAISAPRGVAENGEVFAVEQSQTQEFARVKALGDPVPAPVETEPELLPKPSPRPEPVLVKPIPDNNFTFGRLKLHMTRGTATLFVGVPGPGVLVLNGEGVEEATGVAAHAGRVRLRVRLVDGARRNLFETGVTRVKARVAFTPSGGVVRTKSRKLTLRKTQLAA